MSKSTVKIEIPKDIYEALNPILTMLGQAPLVPKKPRWRREGTLLYDGERKGNNWCCILFRYPGDTDLDEAGLERARDAIVDALNQMEEEE